MNRFSIGYQMAFACWWRTREYPFGCMGWEICRYCRAQWHELTLLSSEPKERE